MNYGKKSTSRRQKEITSTSTMQKKKIGVRLFKAALICLLLICVAGVGAVGMFAKKIVDDSPEISPDDVKPSGFTTFIKTEKGKELDRFVASGSNRVYKTIDQIPLDLQHAFVAIEDVRFYEHNGIDPQGIVRAAVVGVAAGFDFSQGASTLTQQLIKNNVFPNFTEEKTLYDRVERKIQEQYLAVQIEKQMTKEEIMENYLNTINLGQNCLGVQAAAQRYFGKDVTDLTLSESACIAGITKSPSGYNPVSNPDANRKRMKKVLNDMETQGYITADQKKEALEDNIYKRIQKINKKLEKSTSNSTYFVDSLAEQVTSDLKEKLGYTDTQAYNALYGGGLEITATEDTKIQKIVDSEMNNDNNYPGTTEWGLTYALTVTRADGTVKNYSHTNIQKWMKKKYGDSQGLLFSSKKEAKRYVKKWKKTIAKEGDTYDEVINLSPQPQASCVIMEQKTGEVKAISGGRGSKSDSRSYNRATDSLRQPGSCFKVLAVYAPAIDSCGKTLATTIVDEPTKYTNGREVKNWWGASYKGRVTVRKAIEQSMNVVTVKMMKEITPQVGFNYLKNFGFTTLVDNEKRSDGVYTDIAEPLALGGITDGITNLEMTAAYATIANGGEYIKPRFYTKIYDHDGELLLDNTEETHTVLKKTTAWLLINAMEDVVKKGTGTRAQLSNMPVSGKTGTTTSNKDIWFSASTPYYTCSVWGGYDENKQLSNTVFHLTLWQAIMARVHANLEKKDFTQPSGIVKATVCSVTGKLPSSGCSTITEYFAKSSIPTTHCNGAHGDGKGSSASPDADATDDPTNSASSNPTTSTQTNAPATKTPATKTPATKTPATQAPATQAPTQAPATTAPQ